MNLKAIAEKLVLDRINVVMEQAIKIYPQMEGFKYKFSTCKGRSAGRAGYRSKMNVVNGILQSSKEYYIKINLDLMVSCERAWEHIYNETIPHEIAHLVDYVNRDKSGHDNTWRKIAMSLGCKGATYHTLRVCKVGSGRTLDVMDDVPSAYKHLVTDQILKFAKNNTEVKAPSGAYMKYKPTKKAIALWESLISKYGSVTEDRFFYSYTGKGSYAHVINQFKLCQTWFLGKGL
ncbi:SprT-like family protein [Aeromonas phage ZPAH1]|nr:SprT-like family protein [Aeromonas phage ZPAH1]